MAAMTTEATTILIEIFPLLLHERRLWILQPSEVALDHTWLIHHQSGVHPSEIVQDHGAALLGRAWCSDSTIVHSTSWRYETGGPVARTDQLIVTYVIIVQPQPEHAQSLLAGSPLRARSFYRGDLVFADPLEAPAIISAANVLAHAWEKRVTSRVRSTTRPCLSAVRPRLARRCHAAGLRPIDEREYSFLPAAHRRC
jgi:hypothetical protein